jgi:hypothetical protein
LVNGFRVEQRNDWNLGNAWWSFLWTWFNQQLSPPTSSTIPYYPVYLNYWGLNPQPILTFTPEASSVNYQWKDNSNTVYVPASSDPGLRWTVLSWSMTSPRWVRRIARTTIQRRIAMLRKVVSPWGMLLCLNVVAFCMLGFYGALSAQVPGVNPPFANALDQQNEIIAQLKEVNRQLREQNALLRSGGLQVVISETKKK